MKNSSTSKNRSAGEAERGPSQKSTKMLRTSVSKGSKRLMATATSASAEQPNTTKSWATGSEEQPRSFSTPSKYRSALLNGIPKEGPPSLSSKIFKLRYNSPIGLSEAFDTAYAYLKQESQDKYTALEQLESQLSHDPANKELLQQKSKLQVEAEINNPEVRFNFTYNEKYENRTSIIDYSQPVYRELKKQHWESKDQMLLMQRLEQLNVIPDTLPTLEPKAEVSLKFLNHTAVNRFIEPGTLLSSNVTTYPPSIKIQEFDTVDVEKQLYTVLIVNPDVPDLENNSYKTHLQWGLSNVKLDYNDNFITPKRLLEDSSINEIIDYCPPTPEKNLPKQRFAVWVFRQSSKVDEKLNFREFDIRSFVETHQLEAIGAHLWRSEWDMNVPKVRELYGLPTGIVFHKVRGDERM
jgi:large subunit ribosomal protein L35